MKKSRFTESQVVAILQEGEAGVPVAQLATNPKHLKLLERWMKSYRPQELFDENGALVPELAELAPKGERRMGANPHANGGLLLRDLNLPDFRAYAVTVTEPGAVDAAVELWSLYPARPDSGWSDHSDRRWRTIHTRQRVGHCPRRTGPRQRERDRYAVRQLRCRRW